MESRHQQLSELHSYITRVDKEVTLALQTLQWDTHRLLDDKNHMQSTKRAVERTSLTKDYGDTEILFPDAIHDYGTVKLSPSDVSQIIKAAAENDATFKMGATDPALRPTPQSYDRFLSTFTSDERRAIYDAVVSRATPAHTLQDLTLPCDTSDNVTRPKSDLELQAELRDMKRRRTKYKVATKSKNYSQVLREVIKNEMEIYTGIKQGAEDTLPHSSTHPQIKQEPFSPEREQTASNGSVPSTSEYAFREIKREPSSPPLDRRRQNEAKDYHRQNRTRDYTRDRSKEHRRETRNFDKEYEHRDRHKHDSSRRYNTKDHTQGRDYRRDESRSDKHKRSKHEGSASYKRESHYRVTSPNDQDSHSYDRKKIIKTENSSREIADDYRANRKAGEKCYRESDEREIRNHKHRSYNYDRNDDKHVKEEYFESGSHSSKGDKHKSHSRHKSYRDETRDRK